MDKWFVIGVSCLIIAIFGTIALQLKLRADCKVEAIKQQVPAAQITQLCE